MDAYFKVDVAITSSPPGVVVLVDGIPALTPFSLDSLIGFVYHLEATPSTCIDAIIYTFQGWQGTGAGATQDYKVHTLHTSVD